MPVQSPSFFIPASMAGGSAGLHPYETTLNPPFIVEDIYIRGGFRCLPSLTIRDKIPLAACKVGMMVYTPEDNGKIWRIASITNGQVTWEEAKLGGLAATIDPIGVTANSEIFIDPLRVLPPTEDANGSPLASHGDIVTLDSNLTPRWTSLSSSGVAGLRAYKTHTTAILDAFDVSEENFILQLGKFIALLEVKVDIPDILIEAYATEEMSELNPYRFISTEYLLQDTGTLQMPDNSYVKYRRYGFLANLDDPPTNKIYWKVKYLANTEASKDSGGAIIRYRQPTISITYIAIEP